MPDREKVINALRQCVGYEDVDNKYTCIYDGDINPNCPYGGTGEYGVSCMTKMMRDALALLKAQEPRVMKVGEVRNWVNGDRVTREPVVIEMRGGICAWIIDDEVREIPGEENLSSDLYGKTWRCWTSRPDQATREAIPWN